MTSTVCDFFGQVGNKFHDGVRDCQTEIYRITGAPSPVMFVRSANVKSDNCELTHYHCCIEFRIANIKFA